MEPVSALITGGLGLMGSLFGSKKKKNETQVVENRVDYRRMVSEAEAAGFNPLTALRNGGAAGFSVSTQSHPGLSNSYEIVGDMFQTAGRIFQAYQDDKVAEQEALSQQKLVDAQLENIQADTRLKQRGLDVPTATGSRFRTGGAELSATPQSAADKAALAAMVNDPNRVFEQGKATVTNPYPRKSPVSVNPEAPDAEMYEQRYGDIGSNLFGGLNLLDDLGYSLRKWGTNRWDEFVSDKTGPGLWGRRYFDPARLTNIPDDRDFYRRQRGSYP